MTVFDLVVVPSITHTNDRSICVAPDVWAWLKFPKTHNDTFFFLRMEIAFAISKISCFSLQNPIQSRKYMVRKL